MDRPLHYDFRDILIAPARALSAKRIFVMTLFLCAGALVYDLFTYIAVALEGESLQAFRHVYGFWPPGWQQFDYGPAQGVYLAGVALAILALMFGFLGVSVIEIEQIRGNRFLSMGEAIRFSLGRAKQVVLAEASIILFLIFLVVLYLLLGLLVRVPAVGEWIYTLTFVLPGFFVALFGVFILAVLLASIVLLPAAAAADRRGETFAAILETFSSVIRQPLRWLLYTAYGLAAGKIAAWVYAYFCYRAVQLSAWAVSITAGEKAENLVREGLSHLPLRSGLAEQTLSVWPGVDWSIPLWRWVMRGDDVAGYAMAVMLTLVFASIIGYSLSVVATAQARGYVLIRYFKDEYKISSEKPLFSGEELPSGPATTTNGE